MKRSPLLAFVVGVGVLALCTGCVGGFFWQTSTPPPPPTVTPVPKILTVCLPEEPDSLYLYGAESPAARHVWQAIYDGPLDSRSYDHQPVILAGLPDLARGDAAVQTVAAEAGERVVDAGGEVVVLADGVAVLDAEGQRGVFGGGSILMRQLVVTFTLRSDLTWSDGTPLTAGDSVYSFGLAAGGASTSKWSVERTAEYSALDGQRLVWRGVPGYLDHRYWLNFWHPLPRHAWSHLSAAELATAELSTRRPLGWGAFVVDEWVAGEYVALVRNPLYFRASAGLPRLDGVTFRFVPDPMTLAAELAAGRCDVVTHEAADAVRAALADTADVRVLSVRDSRWELLAFGISPAFGYDRPDFFEDERVRQGIAHCIDRQALVREVVGAAGQVLDGFIPPEHPLYAGESIITWAYSPAAGQALLADAGWVDGDGDGVREAYGIPGVVEGTPLRFAYLTTGDPLRVRTLQRIQTDLAACGVGVIAEIVTPEVLLAPGPNGALFGRRFDVAQFSWRAAADPLCDLFSSGQVPDDGRWDRPNVAGFLDDRYDVACMSALESLPGEPGYAAGQTEAQRIFTERLPVLPLFQRVKSTLAGASVIGLAPDATQDSELWNVEQIDLLP